MSTKKSMIKKLLYIIIPIILIAIIVLKLKSNKEITKEKVYTYDKSQPILVEVDTVQTGVYNDVITYSGTFEPNKEVKISAEGQGKVNSIFVELGTFVKKGEPLIQLDNSLLKLQLQNVEVQIEGLEADVKRYSILIQSGAIQGIQLEKSELGLKTAKVQKATLLEQISKTNIKAPFDGVVTGTFCEIGSFAGPGVPLMLLTDIQHLKFTISVPETDLQIFNTNNAYKVSTNIYQDDATEGNIILIGSKANAANNYPIQFFVKNTPDLRIKSGMLGQVEVNNSQNSVITIQANAITGTADKPMVYVIKNGKAILTSISISKRLKSKAIISEGINNGDVIVTSGFINLFDGANITTK